jgi:hypothetical protein
MLTKISASQMQAILELLPITPGVRERTLAGAPIDLGVAGEFALNEAAADDAPDLGAQVATLVEQALGTRAASTVARATSVDQDKVHEVASKGPKGTSATGGKPTHDFGDRLAELVEQQLYDGQFGRRIG